MQKVKFIAVLIMIGTIGIFVNRIPLSSSLIACSRAVLGTVFIAAVMFFSKKKLHRELIRKNGLLLLVSGAALGFNWVLLFEAFARTGVAVGTLCYYMAPVFVILSSPFLLKEKLTLKKLICTLFALCGMIFISGVFGSAELHFDGICYGLGAAVLYALIVICNRKMTGIEGLERSFCQLAVSAAVMCVYVLLTEDVTAVFRLDLRSVIFLVLIGFLHTGLFYTVFFTSYANLPAQTAAILSYTDPISSVLCGAIFLHESFDAFQVFGMVLILGSALIAEVNFKKKRL